MKSRRIKKQRFQRPIWQMILIHVGGATVLAVTAGLVFSSLIAASNAYFYIASILIIAAAVPAIREVFGNVQTHFQARREGLKPRDVIIQQEKEGKYARGTRVTFIYGGSGLLCFGLAVVIPLITL